MSTEHYELMQSKAWKEKLEGAKALLSAVQSQESMEAATTMAVFTYVETATRNWKETNFQVSHTSEVLGRPLAQVVLHLPALRFSRPPFV